MVIPYNDGIRFLRRKEAYLKHKKGTQPLKQQLGTYFARCANSLRYLNKLQDAPIQLWNDFQPEIHSILNPRETREMRKTLLPYFKNKRGAKQ